MLLRVYYEDTDAAGVVYHSNYLNYCERARTEYLRERGWSVAELASDGAVFPVVRMEIDFKAPARHDDLLQVITTPLRVGGSSFELRQQVHRASDGKLLVELLVTLACVTPQLKARRIPAGVRATLSAEVSAA
ncbi:YbgC/FadM family acyl-CoA thioesterase [Trichlorobacter sp.]|jgi:acyl-CoA thioester hydrolase|uniref:acyl-CoA thioesterase n=1 Tax=Trichlorobacter sp. TaxID=2911007 RepID=UPI002A35F7F6|nr:YbgC/FadM family acyl-CoA thioesterase [Trichlorobacter sp.]MDY0385049.1 YbgC/FadM family acyl-CoA thioesterase [Trichlorobacter sp.]